MRVKNNQTRLFLYPWLFSLRSFMIVENYILGMGDEIKRFGTIQPEK